MIRQMKQAYDWHRVIQSGTSTDGLVHPKSMGFGIGLALIVWFMQFLVTVLTAQVTLKANIMGLAARSAVSCTHIPHQFAKYADM